MRPTLATLVYVMRGDRVLMLRRAKDPFAGYWVAPGGKIESGECPAVCAIRELKEETGLTASRPLLRGVVRETSPLPGWQWLLFIYLVTEATGKLRHESSEGWLEWWEISSLPTGLMPAADQVFFSKVIDPFLPVYEAVFHYDADLCMRSVTEPGKD